MVRTSGCSWKKDEDFYYYRKESTSEKKEHHRALFPFTFTFTYMHQNKRFMPPHTPTQPTIKHRVLYWRCQSRWQDNTKSRTLSGSTYTHHKGHIRATGAFYIQYDGIALTTRALSIALALTTSVEHATWSTPTKMASSTLPSVCLNVTAG